MLYRMRVVVKKEIVFVQERAKRWVFIPIILSGLAGFTPHLCQVQGGAVR